MKGKESFVMCFANMLTLSQDVRYAHLSHEMKTNGKGGNNAGHTIVVGDKKYDFHILPSGTFFLFNYRNRLMSQRPREP